MPQETNRSLVQLITDAMNEFANLFQTEIRLVRVELSEKLNRFAGSGAIIGAGAVAAIVALLMLGSASASVLAVVGTSLHQTPPISFSDPNFQGTDEECAGTAAVTWHFVLTQTAAASGTLTATFANGVYVVPSTKKTGGTLHFDVLAGDTTLLGATTDAVGRWLNLSHICGGGTTTTTISTTTST